MFQHYFARKTKLLMVVVAALLTLSACAAQGPKIENLETIYGVSMHPEHLDIVVKSNGCTKAKHFKLERVSSDKVEGVTVHQLALHRIKPDGCRKRSEPKRIRLNLSGLSIAPTEQIQLINSISKFKKAGFAKRQ